METERGSGEFISAQNDHLLIQFHAVKAFMFHCISMLYNKLMYMHTCSTIPSMASSSTSSVPKSFKYDVFLSFRGEDTRHTFVDHLYNALQQKGICTYKDDEKIKKGKGIIDDLFTSIEESRFYIIVFSKTYASSSWCLEELVKIMECQKMTGHTAYPVFYHVEPTEVRKQSGTFGEAFSKHENKESAGKWREALEDASCLAGWEYMNNGENKFIQKIVHEISLELRSINFIVDEKLVGMESRVNEIVSSLETSSNDVRMFGIAGMGGAGKTTLARAVYDKISFLFEGKSFVGNIREASSSSSGLMTLQNQVISDVSKVQSTVSNVFDGKEHIIKSMHCRKVLVVLDDVDRIEQLEALAGDCNWFKPGSRIIITTRDKQVLISHRVLYDDVALLSGNEAICLLSRYAFGTETPIEGYEGLSGQVVDYAAGLPLTIKVLGSKLCGANECTWRDIIERLKEIPLIETQKKLELSYDDLEDEHKETFLDVACIMKGWRKDDAIRALDSCGRHGSYGLRILELKSLITISPSAHGSGRLGMHDHIEEMGQNIVRRPYYDKPHTHSRLWKDEEVKEILATDLGTEATTCIKLKMKSSSHIYFKGFRKMENLRFLHLSRKFSQDKANLEDEVSPYFPDALRYLSWEGYPFRCLPNKFRAKNLVGLVMPFFKGEQLWESGGREVLDKLKFLVLDSSSLTTLDLGVTPNLEMLSLSYCSYVKVLHMPNKLQKLKSITLSQCTLLEELCPLNKLETLWLVSTCGSPNSRTIDLRRSSNLKELHVDLGNDNDIKSNAHTLLKLQMPNALRELKSLFLRLPMLRTRDLGRTSSQPSSLEGRDESKDNQMVLEYPILQNIQNIDIRCPKLQTLNLEMSPNLETVYILSADLIHTSRRASQLKSLEIIGSKNLETLDLSQAVNLETLELIGRLDLVKLDMPATQSKLKRLSIDCSKLSSFDLGLAPNLEYLCLLYCLNLVEVHMHAGYPKLKDLFLKDLPKLRTFDFSMTPNLKKTELKVCKDLLKMPLKFPKLRTLDLNSPGLKTLRLQTPSLKKINLKCCSQITKLVLFDDCPMLRDVFLKEEVRMFTLIANVPEVPLKFFWLRYLNMLKFTSTKIKHLPDSICELQRLETLKLESCHLLEKLPGNLYRLERLEWLGLWDCKSLQDIPSNIGKVKFLEYLSLRGCPAVEKLPEEVGSLENLKVLTIRDTGITHLPESIVLFKDLRIIASGCLLQSCTFTSKVQTSKYETFYHNGTHSRSFLYRAPPTTGVSSNRWHKCWAGTTILILTTGILFQIFLWFGQLDRLSH